MSELPECACPACGAVLGQAQSLDGSDVRHDPGSLTVCFECGTFLAFDAELRLVRSELPDDLEPGLRVRMEEGQRFVRDRRYRAIVADVLAAARSWFAEHPTATPLFRMPPVKMIGVLEFMLDSSPRMFGNAAARELASAMVASETRGGGVTVLMLWTCLEILELPYETVSFAELGLVPVGQSPGAPS